MMQNTVTALAIQSTLDRLRRKKAVVQIHPADQQGVSVRASCEGETAISDVLVLPEALMQAEARLDELIEAHAR